MGICSICLDQGELSREHLPPESCGNTGRRAVVSVECVFRGARSPQVFQNGIVRKSICKRCNSEAGARYVPSLKSWYEGTRENLNALRGPLDDRIVPLRTKPLALAKQIATMWLALTPPTQRSEAIGFARSFVRIPQMVTTCPPWRMFVYMHLGAPCAEGTMGTLFDSGRRLVTHAQVGLFPLGFLVMPVDELTHTFATESRLTDITHFCGLSPDAAFTHHLRLRPWKGLLEQMGDADRRDRAAT